MAVTSVVSDDKREFLELTDRASLFDKTAINQALITVAQEATEGSTSPWR